MFNMS